MKKEKNYIKIGILTFHNAVNYGAVLQAYALSTFIRTRLSKECEVIDYTCEKFKNNYKIFKIYNRSLKGFISSLVKTPSVYSKNRKFKLFMKKNVKLSKEKYNIQNISDANTVYNCFITGSDQVWNLELTNDNTYFLDFVSPENIKLAYAASCGKSILSSTATKKNKIGLKQYKYISVRENSLKDYLSNSLNLTVQKVLDPVFLIEAQEWSKLIQEKSKKREKYILVYLLHEKSIYSIAEKIAKVKNLRITSIQNNFSKPIDAEYKLNCGIEEFLELIKNAEYVITDSFHGAAFSIIFRKQLRIVLKKEHSELNSRIESLIKDFKLESFLVSDDSKIELLTMKKDYDESIINKKISQSKNLLKNMLGDNNG